MTEAIPGFDEICKGLDAATRIDILKGVQSLAETKHSEPSLVSYLDEFEINHSKSARIALEKSYEAYVLSLPQMRIT